MEGEKVDLSKDFDQICQGIAEELKLAPRIERQKSLNDLIKKLYPQIITMQSKGVSNETICGIIFRRSGRNITPKTLKKYLSQIKNPKTKKKKNLKVTTNTQAEIKALEKGNPTDNRTIKPSVEESLDANGNFDLKAFLDKIPDDPSSNRNQQVTQGEWVDGKWREPTFNVIRKKV